MRVGDSERDETTAQLTEHFTAGRLDHSEFTERTEQALAARTRGDLDRVLSDLPVLPVTASPAPTPAVVSEAEDAKPSAKAEWRRSFTTWAIFAVFFVILWVATGAGYFWPIFPILGWGVGVAVSGVQAYSRPDPIENPDQRKKLPPSP